MLTDSQLTDRLSQFERACEAEGIKLTHQRVEVLREVARNDGHPSVDTILAGVKARLPMVSVDTVYRTLWLLTDLRLIATLRPRRDAVRFDANLTPHHHYVCVKCGVVTDVETLDLEYLRMEENISILGTVSSAHLEIHGICSNCSGASETAPATE